MQRAVVAAALLRACAAALVSYCPSGADSICYEVGIPVSTASAGSGNIYFSITAPDTYQWVALGTGSQMAGANIFVVYQDGTGNLTLSPRLGTGHVQPQLDTSSTAADLTLLAGSGVADGTMTAYVRCSNCESWGGGGSMSVTSTSAPWIASWRKGSALDTADQDASIAQHDGYTGYTLDLTAATVSSDSSPWGGEKGSSGDSGGGSGDSDSDSSGDSGSGGSAVSVPSPPSTSILVAHATILGLVMALLYPLGSALMPLLGRWAVHGLWQGVSYLLMWAGFALGVVAAQQRNMLFAGTHTLLGTVVIAAMGVQPVLGLLHHRHFVQHRSRGLVSYVHIWWGRALMVLGVVNGGLGLELAAAPRGAIVGYAVVTGVVFTAYTAVKAGRVFSQPRATPVADSGDSSQSQQKIARSRSQGRR